MNKTPRQAIPEQEPALRIKNFEEVALGYTEEQALLEASRCLQCKNSPCVSGCPVQVQIPKFIQLIKEKKYLESAKKIKETNALPAVCGRVCPQESQCEKKCILGIKGEPVAIGRLERFVADYERAHSTEKVSQVKSNHVKVAIVGSGPAGLTCAADLAKKGFEITVFEAFHQAGGVLVYGIPEFRLPKSIVQKEIEKVQELGVIIKTNMVVGKIVDIEELFQQGYQAIFIGVGAGLPSFLNIPGEDLGGVYSANEFLTRVNLMKAYKFPEYDTPVKIGQKVAVVGGGNVAMDSARSAKRLGAEVYLIYRRTQKEMPARTEESHHAQEEKIIFQILTNPIEILGNEQGNVKAIKCLKMELGTPDESGRRRPIPIPGSEFILEVDSVIMALGNKSNPLLTTVTPGLELNAKGNIIVKNEAGQTSLANVWAAGDIVTGAATVIEAMGAGKKAAQSIMTQFSKVN
ncbi:NADPH-dependent glutamate synthase [bacterium]|nr:NADPH-dependent glutamate synthase [bacterium]MBT3581820.1 NADPH-dependent glutamate synthase [bacterium]MBT4552882.1 NADPH-dependent glutamate synthase [bacterium]MBT7087447.1 NADPH-dependent glutamate synthase [bacterium]